MKKLKDKIRKVVTYLLTALFIINKNDDKVYRWNPLLYILLLIGIIRTLSITIFNGIIRTCKDVYKDCKILKRDIKDIFTKIKN